MTFQYAFFNIFNLKDYDLTMGTFLVYILQAILYILIYTIQIKLEM